MGAFLLPVARWFVFQRLLLLSVRVARSRQQQFDQFDSSACATLEPNRIATGTPCGALGFPLASVSFSATGRLFNLQERFQSASVSAHATTVHASGVQLIQYETDAFMYAGSSGCPGFLDDAKIFAMHVASRTEPSPNGSSNARLAIAVWVPAADIRAFAHANGAAI